MTGYTVHTGSTVKFSGGWDRIFSGQKSATSAGPQAKAAARKSASSTKKKSAVVARQAKRKKSG